MKIDAIIIADQIDEDDAKVKCFSGASKNKHFYSLIKRSLFSSFHQNEVEKSL